MPVLPACRYGRSSSTRRNENFLLLDLCWSLAGAASLISESQLKGERLGGVIAELLNNPAKLAQMSEKARKLSHPNAGREIAQIVTELAERSPRTSDRKRSSL